MNGFVGDVRWFSNRNVAPSYNGNVLRAVRSHLNYLINHDVVDSSFQKQDIGRIIEDLKQYQTRWDARVGGKFFMSLPNDFPIQEVKNFIEKTLPMPIQFDYSVHRSKNKDGQENLHVHVFLRPVNAETGYKLQWKKGDYSQLHKNYRDTLKQYGYDLVTHANKGEEPSIHVGQRYHYDSVAQEYLTVRKEIARVEKEQKNIQIQILEQQKKQAEELEKQKKQLLNAAWKEETANLTETEGKKIYAVLQKYLPVWESTEGKSIFGTAYEMIMGGVDFFTALHVLNILTKAEREQKTQEEIKETLQKAQRKAELKKIRELDPEIVLNKLGIEYQKQKDKIVFKAPYRTDTEPSCFIRKGANGEWQWIDFGTGQQGSLIDLLIACGYEYKDAVSYLRSLTPLATDEKGTPPSAATGSVTLRQSPFSSVANDLKEEKIAAVGVKASSVLTAKQFVEKTRGYTELPDWLLYIEADKDGKQYTGIGTQDVKGSVHLRFLGDASLKECCLGTSSYTHIKQGNTACYIVEGIWDAVALWNYGVKADDIIILNGVENVKQALQQLQQYKTVIVATDMDLAGEKAAQVITQSLKLNQKAWRLTMKSKDPDEAFRSGEKPILKPINIEKYKER